MTKEQINEYSVRISQASKAELVYITYEIIIDYMKDAEKAYEAGNKQEFTFFVKQAMNFIDDLSSSLDMSYEIAHNLISLYMYVKKKLIHANAVFTCEDFADIMDIIDKLRKAFTDAAAQNVNNEKNTKVMQGSEQIYAGYTYGKNLKLNEYVVRNQ